jgi:TRAP-type C4-dicarboxylate transport system substrate-binding protein
MKKAVLISLMIVLSMGLIFTACPKSAPGSTATPILIRMTTPIPGGDDVAKWFEEGINQFNARTNGAYKMQLFPGGQICNLPESLDLIRSGAVEGGFIPLGAFAGTVPELALAELPFLFDGGEANAYAYTSIKDVYNGPLQTECNQITLGCIYTGTTNLHSVKKPVKTLEDLEGMVVGVDAPPMAELITALGGTPIVVDFAEDYSNMQKGVIDAKTTVPQYVLVTKIYEVAKYYTVFHGLTTLYSININLDVYNEMPENIQNALNEEMGSLAENISQEFVTLFDDYLDMCAEQGMQIYYLPAEERDRWKQLAYPSTLEILEMNGDVGAKIRQIAEEANAKYPYVAR